MASSSPEQALSEQQDWPPDGLERVRQCPVCGSAGRELLYAGLNDRVFRCAPGRWNMYQCQKCLSAYLNPRPTPETIHLAYQTYYTHHRSTRKGPQHLSPCRRLARGLANDYRNKRYGGALTPANPVGSHALRVLFPLRKKLDRELRHLPFLTSGSRLLDVGFGNGAFLELARDIGWTVSGADPDPVAVSLAKDAGLDVREGDISAFNDQREQFDVITLNHVIEHVHDPVATLRCAQALLKPGGLLYIGTPNTTAHGHRQYKQYWRGLEIPRHLVMFNWNSLVNILRSSGFGAVKRIKIPNPYPEMAAMSRAIAEGESPYPPPTPRARDRLRALVTRLPLYSDAETDEFITLHAYKDP